MRLTSQLWVSAFLRHCRIQQQHAYQIRRGAEEAGAIFISVINSVGAVHLFAQAPSALSDWGDQKRRFECVHHNISNQTLAEWLAKEANFDPDFWHIEVESELKQHFEINIEG